MTGLVMGGQEAARPMGNLVLVWRRKRWFTVLEVGIIIWQWCTYWCFQWYTKTLEIETPTRVCVCGNQCLQPAAPYWDKRKEAAAAAYFGNSLSEVGVDFLDFLSAGEFSAGSGGGRETQRERSLKWAALSVSVLLCSHHSLNAVNAVKPQTETWAAAVGWRGPRVPTGKPQVRQEKWFGLSQYELILPALIKTTMNPQLQCHLWNNDFQNSLAADMIA